MHQVQCIVLGAEEAHINGSYNLMAFKDGAPVYANPHGIWLSLEKNTKSLKSQQHIWSFREWKEHGRLFLRGTPTALNPQKTSTFAILSS